MPEIDTKTAKELEDRILSAQRARTDANMALAVAEAEYKSWIAKQIGSRQHNIELTSTGPCRSPILHHVYDRRTNWPCCVYCGSPEYGDY